MAENSKDCFFLKRNFNFIILFKLIITKYWRMFTTPATELRSSYALREIHEIKTYRKRETSHCKDFIKNYET